MLVTFVSCACAHRVLNLFSLRACFRYRKKLDSRVGPGLGSPVTRSLSRANNTLVPIFVKRFPISLHMTPPSSAVLLSQCTHCSMNICPLHTICIGRPSNASAELTSVTVSTVPLHVLALVVSEILSVSNAVKSLSICYLHIHGHDPKKFWPESARAAVFLFPGCATRRHFWDLGYLLTLGPPRAVRSLCKVSDI